MGVNDINVLYFAQPPVTRKPLFLYEFFPSFSVLLLFLLYCDMLTFVIVSGRRTEWRGHGTFEKQMYY